MNILMLAAENGALPHGKVGGMGDVIRDLPRAIAALGHEVTVMTPAYGTFARLPGARKAGTLAVPFAGMTEHVDRYSLPGGVEGVTFEVLDHSRFSPHGVGKIYCDDGPGAPFFSDATKFAFFSAAAAAAAVELLPDVLHLHDWHVGFVLALRRFDREFAVLRKIRTVYTVHNLAVQGIRPIAETESSLHSWYPWLRYRLEAVEDPVYPDCVNPMAIGIRHADMVTTVSPTYAREITRANDPMHGVHGGEGLELDLRRADAEGRLVGVLNGCDYTSSKRRPGWKKFVELAVDRVRGWIAAERTVASAHWQALERIAALPKRRPRLLLTSVGRVTGQKLELFRETVGGKVSALERMLDTLAADEWFVLVGSGDPEFERFLVEVETRKQNFLFLNGYSETLADALYTSGDLFLMPSSFEPCGISQMLAMRAGQPCVVHGVGGLKDTVSEHNGFVFGGETPLAQARELVETVAAAAALTRDRSARWDAMRAAAAAERFDWGTAARQYLDNAYQGAHG